MPLADGRDLLLCENQVQFHEVRTLCESAQQTKQPPRSKSAALPCPPHHRPAAARQQRTRSPCLGKLGPLLGVPVKPRAPAMERWPRLSVGLPACGPQTTKACPDQHPPPAAPNSHPGRHTPLPPRSMAPPFSASRRRLIHSLIAHPCPWLVTLSAVPNLDDLSFSSRNLPLLIPINLVSRQSTARTILLPFAPGAPATNSHCHGKSADATTQRFSTPSRSASTATVERASEALGLTFHLGTSRRATRASPAPCFPALHIVRRCLHRNPCVLEPRVPASSRTARGLAIAMPLPAPLSVWAY